jgi:hypothetical protein
MEKIQLIATCVLYMAGAWFTLKESFKIKFITYENNKPKITYVHTKYKRSAYIILYCICTIFSIFTTANMAFNAINRDTSYKIQSSDSYKLDHAKKDIALSEVATNNKQIESLMEQKNNAVNAQLKLVDGWKTTRIKERRNEIVQSEIIAQNYDQKIAQLQNGNTKSKSILDAPPPSASQSASTKSFFDLFGISEKMMMIIIACAVLLLSFGVDLLGAFFTIQYSYQSYMLNRKKSSYSPNPNSPNPTRKKNIDNDDNPDHIAPPYTHGDSDNILAFPSPLGKNQQQNPLKKLCNKSRPYIASPHTDGDRPDDNNHKKIDHRTKNVFYEELKKSCEMQKRGKKNKRYTNKKTKPYVQVATSLGINRNTARIYRNLLAEEGKLKKTSNGTVVL